MLTVVPIELREANDFIAAMHRHHAPVVGHRFSIGVVDESGLLRGVCVVGRPVARLAGHPREVAEVTRLATDGTYNACSILYAAAARACKAMGFRRIQTYTLPSEGGASLRASGWVCEGEAGGVNGNTPTASHGAPISRPKSRPGGRSCLRRNRSRLPCLRS